MDKNEPSRSDAAFTVPIEFKDGTSMKVKVFKAKDKNAPVCIFLPAMGVRADYYESLALELVARGTTIVTCDLRGHGNSSVRPNRKTNFGYNDILSIDLPTIVMEVKNLTHCKKVYLMGHSLGGQLSLLYAVQSSDIEGVILIASGSNYYRNIASSRKRWGRYFGYHIIKMLNAIFGYFPGKIFKFAGTEANQLITDWLNESLTGQYKIAGSNKDYERLLLKTQLPVLFLSFEGDTYVTPECRQYLASKLPAATIEHISLSPESVALNKASHFRWAVKPKAVAIKINTWQKNLGVTI